jgi:hypothetical protein
MMTAWLLAVLAALSSMSGGTITQVDSMSSYKEWTVNGHTVRLPSEATWAPPNPPPPPSPPLPTKAAHGDRAECDRWAQQGECLKNQAYMKVACAASCDALALKDTYKNAASCVSWANAGECETNGDFMFEHCAASCDAVGSRKQAYAARCPLVNGSHYGALKPGGLMPMFERAVSNFPELSPTLLSPSPPVALFDNFVSEEEVQALVRAGRGRFKRSTVLDYSTQGSVTNAIRTSSNTWCAPCAWGSACCSSTRNRAPALLGHACSPVSKHLRQTPFHPGVTPPSAWTTSTCGG